MPILKLHSLPSQLGRVEACVSIVSLIWPASIPLRIEMVGLTLISDPCLVQLQLFKLPLRSCLAGGKRSLIELRDGEPERGGTLGDRHDHIGAGF